MRIMNWINLKQLILHIFQSLATGNKEFTGGSEVLLTIVWEFSLISPLQFTFNYYFRLYIFIIYLCFIFFLTFIKL